MVVNETINQEVKQKMDELKKRFLNKVKPELYDDDFMFYRFLKARDFNVDQAEIMLKKHLEWREEFKVDTILSEKIIPPEVEEYICASSIGFDKGHAPIKYLPWGNLDFTGFHKCSKYKCRIRYSVQVYEEEMALLKKQSEKYNKYLEGSVFINDMKNLTFAKATNKKSIEDAIFVIRLFQNNYPECLKHVFVINASSYFQILFAMLKPFFEASLMNKIQVFTSNEVEWKAALLEKIDADVLPAFLGGNKTDPDGNPLCKTFVKNKGKIPDKFYTCKEKRSFSKSKDAKKLIISQAAFSEIEIIVEEPGSHIEWEFETKARDIGFGLFFNEKEADGTEKITELVPLLRLDTDEFSEIGMYKCEKAGKYVILFDNSYSWVRSKEVYYKATILTPKQLENEIAATYT